MRRMKLYHLLGEILKSQQRYMSTAKRLEVIYIHTVQQKISGYILANHFSRRLRERGPLHQSLWRQGEIPLGMVSTLTSIVATLVLGK